MLEDLAKFNGLRVFSLVLLVIATPQGRQIYDTANSVEAERGIKTFTWDVVEDNDPEIHQEHDDEEHDEDFLDLAFEKKSAHKVSLCTKRQNTIKNCNLSSSDAKSICEANNECRCRPNHRGECERCQN